jgi:hypothetical protein
MNQEKRKVSLAFKVKHFISVQIFYKHWNWHHNRLLGLDISSDEMVDLLMYGVDYDIWSELYKMYPMDDYHTGSGNSGWDFYWTMWKCSSYPFFKRGWAFLF